MKAQVCRPFIPQIFPGYRCYLYLDSDCWVQKRVSGRSSGSGAQCARASGVSALR